ncbi:MAG: sugar phosphate isomerase/epimerase [Chloroflexi bacterium]|nr:sugar phosphate isomerase/epimerase [Chloroflexota bacterium]
MLLGFNGATTMTSALPTDIRIAGQAGYDVLEITATKLDKYLQTRFVSQVRQMIDAAGLKTHAINSIEKINFQDEDGHMTLLGRTEQLAQYCRALDCPWIVAVPGPAPQGAPWREIRDNTVASLRAMSAVAAKFGANLAFEFLGFPWCSVQTAAQAWEIVKTVNLPNVGMVIDTCHFYAGGSTLESIREIDVRKLAVFHINDVEQMPKEKITDANRLFPGDGVIPLKDIIAAVRGIGYDGVASVEIFRPEYWQRDPLAVAKEAREKSKRVLELTTQNSGV